MLALLARTRTGRGQAIEVTMLQGNAWANADEAYDYLRTAPRLFYSCTNQRDGLHALYRLYPASEGWVFLACPFDREWRRFCLAVSRPDLTADSRFSSSSARAEHDQELAEEISQVFASRTAGEWEQLLTETRESHVCAPTATLAAFLRIIRSRP